MNIRSAWLGIIVISAIASVSAQERFVKPVDEASLDPSFAAFRTKLIAAAERRDTAYIIGILDRNVSLSFGGDEGLADFKRIWKPDRKGSLFWAEFLAAIRNGGTFDRENGKRRDSFSAPYTFNSFPEDLDAFDYHVIFGSDVNLRKEPNIKSESIAKLSYNVVKVEPETIPKSGKSEYPGWFLVKTLGGIAGFVKREFVRSPIDYRAIFEKRRGRWVMTAFVSGD